MLSQLHRTVTAPTLEPSSHSPLTSLQVLPPFLHEELEIAPGLLSHLRLQTLLSNKPLTLFFTYAFRPWPSIWEDKESHSSSRVEAVFVVDAREACSEVSSAFVERAEEVLVWFAGDRVSM